MGVGKAKPVYVELDIRADIEALWERTQTPELHERWDLRFSEIRYLPREAGGPQRFLYATRIGFGLRIAGTGETTETANGAEGVRTSALRFGSDSRLSLIREGGGFWRYVPHGGTVTFLTRYDYKTRFGPLGRAFDRVIFRPLIGWATAWSFDRLRLWLECGIPPAVSFGRWLSHKGGAVLLALLWLYQAVVPKLIAPWAGELELMRAAGAFPGREREALIALGLLEAAMGLLVAFRAADKKVHALACAALAALAVPALIADPSLWAAPVSPIALNAAMIGLHGAVAATSADLPSARNCRRKPATPER
ncbi:DoxX-like family protein [Paenibacillus sp. GYB003]|uniref:DoxX-like family protein n=1 Tax=Paenibacillus sp. GYB003 TaxID=2994392 RepID=UPI002F965C76